jgi:protein-tyrosine-phosphatase
MLDTHILTQAQRHCLLSAARDLQEQFRGVFGEETIQALLFSSYAELAAGATVDRWLVIGAERFTRQRFRALAHAESRAAGKVPSVLSSACITPGARRWRWAGLPGKRYEDWELDDPSGKTIEEIRPIRDQIRDRVTGLL